MPTFQDGGWLRGHLKKTGDHVLIEQHCLHLCRRNLAEATIHIRRHKLEAIDAEYGLATATTEQIEGFLDRRHISAKTRYCWISHLSCFYRWAIDHGHLDRDPTVRVTRPKTKVNLPRPIATDDLVLALEMANPMMRAWLLLGSLAGLRCAEVAHLTVADLLWDDRLIHVVGKGDKPRLVPMHDEVAKALHSMPLPSRGPVFRRPRGGPFPAAQVSREGSLYFQGLGIGATMHQLRHWFGTQSYRACRDLRVVQEMMGHASPTTTAIYADWSREEAYRAVASLSLSIQPNLLSDWAA